MRPINWTLSTGMILALSANLWAQAAPMLPAPQTKTPAPALAGTTQGEARRKTLLGAIEDYKTFLPADQENPLTKKFQPDLQRIKQDATDLKTGGSLDPLESRFEAWKQSLLSDLYAQNQQRFFSDPQRFSDFMQERLDALAAIRSQKARAPQKIKQLDTLAAQINTLPDRSILDRIYDKLGAARASLRSAPIRLVSFSGPTQTTPTAIPFSAPRTLSPDTISPPPSVEPASYKPQTTDGWTLSNIISTVSGTAKRYAAKVADAIVNFSKKIGLDEKLQAAIIWSESAFNPGATSGSGAMGLGQLMPGTATGLGVRNAYDIDQNVKGSSTFLKSLLGTFTSDDEMRYTQGLYAWGKDRVSKGQNVDAVWKDVFAKTPLGVKNAIAAYNAGSGAITKYAHGDYTQLPRKYTQYAMDHNQGYWQTVNYVPTVLRHYFDISLKTPSKTTPTNGLVAI